MKAPFESVASMALFAEVVKQQSFTAAAARVGIAKSALSKRIAELEDRLGVRLLTRTTRSLRLTEEGARFYEHCAELLSAAGAAEGSVAGLGETARGPLRINAPVTFAEMFLVPVVASFLARHEGVELELSTENRLVDVLEGGFDLVLRIGVGLEASSLVAKKLCKDRLVVCGSPEYLERRGRPATPLELVGHNCLHYTLVGREAEWRFRGESGPLSIPVRGNLNTSDGSVLRKAALAGVGLVVLPWFMVAADVRAGRLELVIEGFRRAEIGIYAVMPSRRNVPARTRLLLEHLTRHFSDPEWRFAERVEG